VFTSTGSPHRRGGEEPRIRRTEREGGGLLLSNTKKGEVLSLVEHNGEIRYSQLARKGKEEGRGGGREVFVHVGAGVQSLISGRMEGERGARDGGGRRAGFLNEGQKRFPSSIL